VVRGLSANARAPRGSSANAIENQLFDSSVRSAVHPRPAYCRIPYTFAHMPLNAGCLVVSQVASTARQEHQRRSQDRSFDEREHVPRPSLGGRHEGQKGHHSLPTEEGQFTEKAGENVAHLLKAVTAVVVLLLLLAPQAQAACTCQCVNGSL
jgi:hypothetical protein